MSTKIYSILFIFTLCLYGLAQSDMITPQSIVINPEASFEVEVWVDRDPSGNTVPHYDLGESIYMNVLVSEASYVYLFNIHSDGAVDQILPNRLDGTNNYLYAGEIRRFPSQGARYSFTVGEPEGIDKVIALASKEPLDTSTLSQFDSAAAFASSKHSSESFARSLSITVSPVKEDSWVIDTVHFAVGNMPVTHTNSQEISNSANPVLPDTSDNSIDVNTPSAFQAVTNNAMTTPVETSPANNANAPSSPGVSNESITIVPTDPANVSNTSNPSGSSPPSPTQTPSDNITIAPTDPVEESSSTTSNNPAPSTSQVPNNTISISPISPSSPSSPSIASIPTGKPAPDQPPPNSITIAPLSITPAPSEPEIVTEKVIFDALNLKFCAGTQINSHKQDPNSARVNFASDVSLEKVHDCYYAQLSSSGWQLLNIEQKNNSDKILASYSYQSRSLNFNLVKLKNGNYRLNLSIK